MNGEINLPILKSVSNDLETQKVIARSQVDPLTKLAPVDSTSQSEPPAKQEESVKISLEELDSVVTDMNSVAQNLQRDLLFSVDEKSGGTFVQVIDKETEEIVREIPSKEIREIKARLEEVSGMIFMDNA